MSLPNITLTWPDHPAIAEMVDILKNDVSYTILGARFRQARTGAANAIRTVRLARYAALQMRQSSFGAITYQRIRSALLLKASPPGQLVHCCNHLIYSNRPWIGDYENVNVLGFYSPSLLQSSQFTEHLRSVFAAQSCRAIRVWSESARQSFHAVFPDQNIRNKLRVLPPAIAFPDEARKDRPAGRKPRVLFVAKGFWVKGGAVFLDALKVLRGRLDFQADFICELPPECDHYRTELDGVVNFYNPVFSRPELFARFYRNSDIFVMLGMADSYGLALLEASAFRLPIIAMRLNSGLSDLLRETGNAIQIEPDHQIFDSFGVHSILAADLVHRIRTQTSRSLVERVAAAIEGLLVDRDLRAELGNRGQTAILEGKLSPEVMRCSMLRLYASAGK